MWGRFPELHLSLLLHCDRTTNFPAFGNIILLTGFGIHDFISLLQFVSSKSFAASMPLCCLLPPKHLQQRLEQLWDCGAITWGSPNALALKAEKRHVGEDRLNAGPAALCLVGRALGTGSRVRGARGLCLPGAARWEQHVQSIQHRLDKCVKQPMPVGNQFAWKD